MICNAQILQVCNVKFFFVWLVKQLQFITIYHFFPMWISASLQCEVFYVFFWLLKQLCHNMPCFLCILERIIVCWFSFFHYMQPFPIIITLAKKKRMLENCSLVDVAKNTQVETPEKTLLRHMNCWMWPWGVQLAPGIRGGYVPWPLWIMKIRE